MRLQQRNQVRPASVICFGALLCAVVATPQWGSTHTVERATPSSRHSTSPSLSSEGPEGRIKIDVVVTAKSGKVITGLDRKDFTLLDSGQPSDIVSFSAFDGEAVKPNPPVEVILVIDSINHRFHQVPDVLPDVQKFLRHNGGRLKEPVTIYLVSETKLSVTRQPTTDGNALAEEISRTRGLCDIPLDEDDLAVQNSSFRNQVIHTQTALRALGSIVLLERSKPGRKLLVWIGYGGLVGEKSFDWVTEFSTRIREARITLSSVTLWGNGNYLYEPFLDGVRSASQATENNLVLEVLAAQSGGHVLEIQATNPMEMSGKESEIEALIEDCVRDAKSFYTISFNPPRAEKPDEYHDLKIEIAKPGAIAHTNSGYYDQPVYHNQPFVPAARVTVAQLEQELATARGGSDAACARQLSATELTERMSSATLAEWKPRLPGAKTRAALVALADLSSFLDPPLSDIDPAAPPDLGEQQLMQAKIVDYLEKTIPKLPDFFATRAAARYRESPLQDGQTWKTSVGDRSLHLAGRTRATVLYRGGTEVVDMGKGKQAKAEKERLKTRGIFGPVVNAALGAVNGKLTWARWEKGTGGRLAVFRFSVPEKESHYQISFCCLLDDGYGSGAFDRLTAYHGEIAIDPESGAMLRLIIEADLDPDLHPADPILYSKIVVEYGPVQIGANTRICLLRAVSDVRPRSVFDLHEWGQTFKLYGPFETLLDDFSFTEYHMFRGEARVLTGDKPAQ